MRRGFGFHDRHSPFRFDPATLFNGGVIQGVLYDPSDLTTLFQDSAGASPVTTAGQTIGLMLDKSKGLMLGAQLLSGGTPQVVGSATAATYNTTTGVGSATRVDASNQSFVIWSGLQTGAFYVISISNTGSVTLGVRSGTQAGSQTQVSAGASATLYIQGGSAGNITITSIGGTINFTVTSLRILPGNHAYQTSSGNRPLWQQASGLSYLTFDGSDDSMLTNSINFSATNSMMLVAGVRKLSDATEQCVVELGTDTFVNNGSFSLFNGVGGASTYRWISRGTTTRQVSGGSAAPVTNVLTGIGNISTPEATLRGNGAQLATSAATQGTGNFGNYPLYIGRRNNATLPFNGRLYGLIVLGAAASSWQIQVTEQWMAGKTGLQF